MNAKTRLTHRLRTLDRLPAPSLVIAGLALGAVAATTLLISPVVVGVGVCIAVLALAAMFVLTAEPVSIPQQKPAPNTNRSTLVLPNAELDASLVPVDWLPIPTGTFRMGGDGFEPALDVTVMRWPRLARRRTLAPSAIDALASRPR